MQKLSSSSGLDSTQTDVPVRPMQPIKGRGAASQITHRFARELRQGFDDGWGKSEQDGGSEVGEEVKTWGTHLEWERAKSALSRHESPDLPFHLGLNPYRGCEHGCIYCYARPTHGYLGYSPGLDFETRLIAKQNLPEVLRAELSRSSHVAAPIMLGSVTDCYQPVEREVGLTRRVIGIRFPSSPRAAASSATLICWCRWHSSIWWPFM